MQDAIRAALVVLVFAGAASAQTPAGPELLVNTYTTGRQFEPRAAMAADGDFVVAWASHGQDGSLSGAFGQRFAASGARQGIEFRINTYTMGYQVGLDVAGGPRGDFVVVWEGDQPGSYSRRVQGQRYDAAGSPIGGEFVVSTDTTRDQWRARVAQAPDGRFVASWTTRSEGSATGIAARRYDAAGNPLGGPFVVNAYTTGYQNFGDVAVAADGSFVVVWEDSQHGDGDESTVLGHRYDASGNLLGSEFQVNTYTTGSQGLPSVSVSPAGGFVVAWTSNVGVGYSVSVRSRVFDASGSPVGNDFVVNTYTPGTPYGGRVAHDAVGNFVVTWMGPGNGSWYDSFVQRFSASGARRGGEFRVNTYTTGSQIFPSVASDAVGNFVVAWDSRADQDGSQYGVFAQRFGGLGPAALVVDNAGNGVLDPGETADLRPSWRNFNGAAQTFGGALLTMTGPAGATYAIADGAGDYGTVPDGADGQCIDCYAVSVSNPATRPAVHWDASAVESILPDTQGQQKQWLLHMGASFTDVPASSGFYRFIETLLHHGVTSGCNPSEYCPASSTTREQMAVFVLRTLDGTLNPPACAPPNLYGDVPESNPFCPWIEELTRRTVVSGCGDGNYCPTAPVTREQMGVFLTVTFGLTLYGP